MNYKQRRTLRRKVVKLVKSGKNRGEVATELGLTRQKVNNYYHYETVRVGNKPKKKYKTRKTATSIQNVSIRETATVAKIYSSELDNRLVSQLISHLKNDFIPNSGTVLKPGERMLFEILVAV